MTWWRPGALALLTALVPATAFVFVPTRGEIAARWSLPASAAALVADSEANLFIPGPETVAAFETGTGRRLWTWTPPAGHRPTGEVLTGDGVVVLVSRDRDTPAEVELACVDLTGAGEQPRGRWSRRLLGVPPGGIHLFGESEGVVAAVSETRALTLELGDGSLRATAELGPVTGAVAWAGECGAAPAGGGAVVWRLADRGDAIAVQHLPAPGGDAVTATVWEAAAGRLTLLGGRGVYSSRFVIVPTRGERFVDDPVTVAPSGATVISRPDRLYALLDGALVATDGETGRLAWRLEPPDGFVIRELPQVAGGTVLVAATRAAATLVMAVIAATGEVRWQTACPGVPPGGVYLPRHAETGRELGVAAVLSRGALLVLDLATGQERARRELGTLASSSPLWLEDSGFVALAGAEPAVVGFDILSAGQPTDPSRAWHWRVPAGQRLLALEWLASGRVLAARTEAGVYVFE